MKKKKLNLNIEWPEAVGMVGGICGFLSFIAGISICIAMVESAKATESSIAALFFLIGGMCLSMGCSALVVKWATREMLEDMEEDEKEKEELDCENLDYCPQESPHLCVSFGTTACPQELKRGDV